MSKNEFLGSGFKPLKPNVSPEQADKVIPNYPLAFLSDADNEAILASRSYQTGFSLYKLVISPGITTMVLAGVSQVLIGSTSPAIRLKPEVWITDFVTPTQEDSEGHVDEAKDDVQEFPTVLVPSKFENN